MTWLAAFLSSFLHVSVRCAQQLNVVHNKYLWVLPCSLLMGATEVFGVVLIVDSDSFLIFIPLGLGGAAGCLTAMLFHRRLRHGQLERPDDVPDTSKNPPRVDDSQGIEIDGDLCNEWR